MATPSLFQTHEQCEAAEPRYVDGVTKPRLIPVSGVMLQIMPARTPTVNYASDGPGCSAIPSMARSGAWVWARSPRCASMA
jgi:hypothetical protein